MGLAGVMKPLFKNCFETLRTGCIHEFLCIAPQQPITGALFPCPHAPRSHTTRFRSLPPSLPSPSLSIDVLKVWARLARVIHATLVPPPEALLRHLTQRQRRQLLPRASESFSKRAPSRTTADSRTRAAWFQRPSLRTSSPSPTRSSRRASPSTIAALPIS